MQTIIIKGKTIKYKLESWQYTLWDWFRNFIVKQISNWIYCDFFRSKKSKTIVWVFIYTPPTTYQKYKSFIGL